MRRLSRTICAYRALGIDCHITRIRYFALPLYCTNKTSKLRQRPAIRSYTDGPYRLPNNPKGVSESLGDEKFRRPEYTEVDVPNAQELRRDSKPAPKLRGPADPSATTGSTRNTDDRVLGTTRRLPEFSLFDKVVIVSGGATGIGLSQSEALLEAGAKVYCLDRVEDPGTDFEHAAKRAKDDLNTSLEYRQVDVRDVPRLNSVVMGIADDNHRLDGLLAAVGVHEECPALDYNAEDARTLLDINLVGNLMVTQAAARAMLNYQCRGSIAMIASMSGTVVNRGLPCAPYNASKAGVIQLCRNLAAEWGQYGIRVNTISPGYTKTRAFDKMLEVFPEREREWGSQNMLGRIGKPEDHRGAAVFLLSPASSWMTGVDLRIDGGHAAW